MPWAAIISVAAALPQMTHQEYKQQYQQQWVSAEPAYPESTAPEFNPLMASLLDLLEKDKNKNEQSTDI